MFDPNAHIPRPNRTLIYMGACMIAGIRLARERRVHRTRERNRLRSRKPL